MLFIKIWIGYKSYKHSKLQLGSDDDNYFVEKCVEYGIVWFGVRVLNYRFILSI